MKTNNNMTNKPKSEMTKYDRLSLTTSYRIMNCLIGAFEDIYEKSDLVSKHFQNLSYEDRTQLQRRARLSQKYHRNLLSNAMKIRRILDKC